MFLWQMETRTESNIRNLVPVKVGDQWSKPIKVDKEKFESQLKTIDGIIDNGKKRGDKTFYSAYGYFELFKEMYLNGEKSERVKFDKNGKTATITNFHDMMMYFGSRDENSMFLMQTLLEGAICNSRK